VQPGTTPTRSKLPPVVGQMHIAPFLNYYTEQCSIVSPLLAPNHLPPTGQQHERTQEDVLSKILYVCSSHEQVAVLLQGIVLHVLHENLHHLVLCIHDLHSDGWVRTSTAPTTASTFSGCHLAIPKHRKQTSVLSRMIYTRDK
jgi:hypothetical protein